VHVQVRTIGVRRLTAGSPASRSNAETQLLFSTGHLGILQPG